MPSTKINGANLSWRESGRGDAILLLHAFPLHMGMWDPQFAGLETEFRVIAFDARGFGASSEAPAVLGMDVIADDAAALLHSLGIERAVVCGLSMGGYAALEMYRRHPQLFRGIVLADTKAGADNDEGKVKREAFAKGAVEHGEAWVANEMLPKLLRKDPDPAIAVAVRQLIRQAAPTSVASGSRGLARRSDSFDLLPTITCPALVIVGSDDVVTPPKEAKAMAAAIPGARLVEIPGAAHLSNLEAPAAFNAALKSLR